MRSAGDRSRLASARTSSAAAVEIDERELGLALRLYTRNRGYIRAVARGGDRFDLVGEPAGAVTAEARRGRQGGCHAGCAGADRPRQLSLADLRAAALARKAVAA